jgi:WD40 repeat protein
MWRAVASFVPGVSDVVALGSTCRAIGGVLPAMIGARRRRTGILGRAAAPPTVCHMREMLAITTARVPSIARGSIVATSSADNDIKLWAGGALLGAAGGSRAAPTCVRTLTGHVSDVRSLAWLGPLESTAGLLASGSWSEIRVWCMHTGACLCALRDGGMQWVNSLACIPPPSGAGATLLLSGSEDRVVRAWRVARSSAHGPARVERVARLEGHAEMVNVVVPLSPSLVASGAHDRTVRLWPIDGAALLAPTRGESATLKPGRVLRGHGAAVRALVALPPAQLASGSADHTIRVWCSRSGACLRVLAGAVVDHKVGLRSEAHGRSVTTLAVLSHSQRRWLVSGGDDGTLRVWDLEKEGSCLCAVQAHRALHYSDRGECVLSGGVKCAAVLDEDGGGLLVTGSADRGMRLWA